VRRVIASGLVIGLSSALLWHFSNIWRYGKHFIQEPNTPIFITETAFLVVIWAFGFYSLIKEAKQ